MRRFLVLTSAPVRRRLLVGVSARDYTGASRRCLLAGSLALIALALSPGLAAAGGTEFPANGVRNLGRGATGFTRADDPAIMTTNPALLADLWDDMAYSGLHLILPDACFQATGSYGWQTDAQNDNSRFGYITPPRNSKALDGTDLTRIGDEPFPEVCYNGPSPKLPALGLSMKLAPNLGVGLGFFPPDNAATTQFGNRDGSLDTPNGLRPSPGRWFRAHLNTSYFSALGAVGWRPVSWLRLGIGFQWQLVVFSATQFTRPDQFRTTANDVRVDVTGRDLFIPGVIASAQINPIDNLDIGIGFKWSDRVVSKAKLDITTGYWGAGRPYSFLDANGAMQNVGGPVPSTANNRLGNVDSPPIWVPQLTLGIRYADRLKPRVPNDKWKSAHLAAGRTVEDSMQNERWDIEANGVIYFNSVNDVSRFTTSGEVVNSQGVAPNGMPGTPVATYLGQCLQGTTAPCPVREVPTYLHGKTQFSARLGGDYNILPGVLSVRAGVSFESDGQDVEYLNITSYQLGRTGLHAGVTLRIAGKTDLSFAFAHFFQKNVELSVNPARPFVTEEPERYHVVQKGDGVAKFAIPDATDNAEGPQFANAGTFYYHLNVVSVSLAQHF
jgi:hypothetical protein